MKKKRLKWDLKISISNKFPRKKEREEKKKSSQVRELVCRPHFEYQVSRVVTIKHGCTLKTSGLLLENTHAWALTLQIMI